jgi:hypothetical protein
MVEHQNYQTSFIFSVKDHPGLQFWVGVGWERQAWQEQLSIIQKLLADMSSNAFLLLVTQLQLKWSLLLSLEPILG